MGKIEKANDMCKSLLILCRWILNSSIHKLYKAVYITSNVVVGKCSGGGVWWSGRVLCEINYWITTDIEVA